MSYTYIEKYIDYNDETKNYRLRKTIDGKRKDYYAKSYEEIKQIKEQLEKVEKKKEKNKLKQKLNDINEGYVYIVSDGHFCKIGVSNDDVNERIKKLQTGNPNKITLLTSLLCKKPYTIESFLHSLFVTKHVHGEWYDILDLFEGENDERNCSYLA